MFLPTVKRTDPQALEWHKFSRLLSAETISLDDISQHVDSINASTSSMPNFASLEKKDLPFVRKKLGEDPGLSNNESSSFNPSKTFGGERARMMFMKGETEETSERKETFNNFGMGSRADESKRNFGIVTGQSVLPGL